MNNFATRIVFVSIAVPALFALALYVPFMNHAPIALIVLAFAVGSSVELRRMLEPSGGKARTVAAVVLGALPPLAVYASRLLWGGEGLLVSFLAPLAAVMVAAFMLFAVAMALPRPGASTESAIRRAVANAFYLLYPGALSSAIVVILGSGPGSGSLLIWFALIVFGNDSLAWLAGVTLGRRRGIFSVSPNKSLEGLVAGLSGSLGFALAGPFLFPASVTIAWPTLSALGLACGAAVVIGDLFESAIKRAAGVKDSGSIVPGRGGVLDSFDSLLFAAPVFVAVLGFAGALS